MILTEGNGSTRIKTRPIVTLPTSEDRNSCEFFIYKYIYVTENIVHVYCV
jgi:hypothetical protein